MNLVHYSKESKDKFIIKGSSNSLYLLNLLGY